jgi:hypothetical protein
MKKRYQFLFLLTVATGGFFLGREFAEVEAAVPEYIVNPAVCRLVLMEHAVLARREGK